MIWINDNKSTQRNFLLNRTYVPDFKNNEVQELTNDNGFKLHYSDYTLNAKEYSILKQASENPLFDQGCQDDQEFLVKIAFQLSPQLADNIPNLVHLIKKITFTDTDSFGLLIVQKLPKVSHPWRLEVLLSSLAGTIQHYPEEGEYIVAIKKNPKDSCSYPSYQNLIDFYGHTDLSYIDAPPNVIALHCIKNDPRESGYSLFCEAKTIASMLSEKARKELQKSNFRFTPPQHYKGNQSKAFPILTCTSPYEWNIRFRRDKLEYIDKTQLAFESVNELINTIDRSTFKIKLPENSFIFINNQTLLHGRADYERQLGKTPFFKTRHLNRIYISSE